ncbi:uncharacterized protein PAC_16929 [Phialocephala subalpina]|uniref:Uncharacterized protein n=1 Tax=Phialocephala subalpina TaxID=576137 RepID=A0A1L7XPR5_9HELO|nr:uncharacterized protein PAC_16929 [Phialocephala subalpina]
MVEKFFKLPACPFCWDQKHKCHRDPASLQCRDCKSYIRQGNLQDNTIHDADQFYEATAHAELYRGLSIDSLSTLDINIGNPDRNIFGLQITTSTGNNSNHYTHHIDAPFNVRNVMLVTWFDGIVRENSTLKIHGKGRYAQAVENAVLLGGYIYMLCSSSRITEDVQTTRDGAISPNEMVHYALYVHFQYFVLCRLLELMNQTLDIIRFEDPEKQHSAYTQAGYASALILRYEVDHFRRSLRNGPLSQRSQVPFAWKGPKGILVDWFTNIEAELHQRLRQGCGQQVDWSSALGAKKSARRKFDTFKLKLTLHQIKHTIPITPPSKPIYSTLGDGDVCWTSPPTSPSLPVLGLSNDSLVVEDKIRPHVSYFALHENSSTEAETSEKMNLDLFPDLALLR